MFRDRVVMQHAIWGCCYRRQNCYTLKSSHRSAVATSNVAQNIPTDAISRNLVSINSATTTPKTDPKTTYPQND